MVTIQPYKLIEQFKRLSYEDKKKKIINLLQAIYDRTKQFGDVLDLLKKVEDVPVQLIIETYKSIILYGDDMNNIKIKEKMGKTAYKLKLIRQQEAKERLEEQGELKKMEEMIMNMER